MFITFYIILSYFITNFVVFWVYCHFFRGLLYKQPSMRVGPLAHATWLNISQAAHLASTKGIGSLAWRIHHNDETQNPHMGNYIEYVYTRICLYIYICMYSVPQEDSFFFRMLRPENRRGKFDPTSWKPTGKFWPKFLGEIAGWKPCRHVRAQHACRIHR